MVKIVRGGARRSGLDSAPSSAMGRRKPLFSRILAMSTVGVTSQKIPIARAIDQEGLAAPANSRARKVVSDDQQLGNAR
jgi:hypothetical protein